MENVTEWHSHAISDEQRAIALAELDELGAAATRGRRPVAG